MTIVARLRMKSDKAQINGLRKRLIAYPSVVYVGIVIVLACLENTLIYPAPKFPDGNWAPTNLDPENAAFVAADGVRLHGWYVPHHNPRAMVLYFHGNGENVSHCASVLKQLRDELSVSVFAVDYRGYGKSEGQPSEQGIYLDARAALKWLCDKTGSQPRNIIFQGRSLGGAVAVELAQTQGCRALVLENTFSSMPDAASSHYRWIPVRWVMRNRYPSDKRIIACDVPLLQSHGTSDAVVPLWSARKLFAASISRHKQFIEIPGGSHNDYPPPEFLRAFDLLISGLAGDSAVVE